MHEDELILTLRCSMLFESGRKLHYHDFFGRLSEVSVGSTRATRATREAIDDTNVNSTARRLFFETPKVVRRM